MKNTVMLGLLAETSIHPGTGRTMGVVDLPVAREAATDYPVLVGSSLKGALRSAHRDRRSEDVAARDELFGKQDNAGHILVGDGRLLLLPVRSLTGAFRWATCPHLIERFRRDRLRAGLSASFKTPSLDPEEGAPRPALGGDNIGTQLFLEERHFKLTGAPEGALVEALKETILHPETRERLEKRLLILDDDDFAWFARYGLAIQARNALKEDTKKSVSLWYEETLPPETVLYSVIAARNEKAIGGVRELFPDTAPYLQAGGNETVGQGWFAIRVLPEGGAS